MRLQQWCDGCPLCFLPHIATGGLLCAFDLCKLIEAGTAGTIFCVWKQAMNDAHILDPRSGNMPVFRASHRSDPIVSRLNSVLCACWMVQNALATGFDFVLAPLARPEYRRRPRHALAPGLLHAPFTRDVVMMASGHLNRQARLSCHHAYQSIQCCLDTSNHKNVSLFAIAFLSQLL